MAISNMVISKTTTHFRLFFVFEITIFKIAMIFYTWSMYRVVVSVSMSRSRDGLETYFSNVSVSAKCGKVSVSVSSRTESQTSRSRLGLGLQRLVYKWTFKQIFQFLSLSYKTNMSDICFSYIASSSTCFRFVKSST